MKHFDITEWADFVLGVATPGDTQAMERHLAGGCPACSEIMDLLHRVRRLGLEEVQAHAPERLVGSAKRIFRAEPASPPVAWTDLPRLPVELVYSSLDEFSAVGVRASPGTLIQEIYHAGDYAVEMQIEPDGDPAGMVLVGQILKRTDPEGPVTGVPVRLAAGNRTLASTESNRFGEFCSVAKWQRGIRLCLLIPTAGEVIEIPLDRFPANIWR